MKKLIFGIALFGGTFALTNEIVKANTVEEKNSSIKKYVIDCSPEGTCTIWVYCNGVDNPPTDGPLVYTGKSYEWCQWKSNQLMSFCP